MKGIVYKDVCLFFKSIDKWLLLVLGGLLVLFAAEGGVYAGMLFSVALDMMVGVVHVMTFEKEGKVDWAKYQRTFPLSGWKVVAGKYAAVLLSMLAGLIGAVVFNLAAFSIYGTFLPLVLGLSVLLALAIPLAWTAITLPFCYWFSFQVAQYTSMPLAFLLFFSLKNIEDGMWTVPDLLSIVGNPSVYLPLGLLAILGAFLLSMAVSAAGCCCRKR